ncbi:hypothetical protein [Azospirillum argentinense]|uniref:Uncharacterized protein n=1 Tax=Azospirillum brasilense TaxID=192 RepID=A0A4D8QBQ0_AZOBR|nr:hypothetical protein [Azospirillum argentinense]QCO05460.1 hypothetical protein D3867_26305 [Azospirillum argentinense]
MVLDNDLLDKWLLVQFGADAAFCRELIEEIQDLRDELDAAEGRVDDLRRKENEALAAENEVLSAKIDTLNANLAEMLASVRHQAETIDAAVHGIVVACQNAENA